MQHWSSDLHAIGSHCWDASRAGGPRALRRESRREGTDSLVRPRGTCRFVGVTAPPVRMSPQASSPHVREMGYRKASEHHIRRSGVQRRCRTMFGRPRRVERTPVMSEAIGLGGTGTMTRDRSLTLFGQTMAYVAATAGLFALGAYAGRNLSESLGWVWFIAAIACLFGMNFTSRRSVPATVFLLGAFGVLMGLATAPLLVYYAATDPAVLWQAGGATALFIAGFGAAGYAIRRGSDRLRQSRVLRAPGPHHFWHRADPCAHTSRDTHLRSSRPRRLRRPHDVRLSASSAAFERRRFGPTDGRVDLPRHLECVLVLSPDLRGKQLTGLAGR